MDSAPQPSLTCCPSIPPPPSDLVSSLTSVHLVHHSSCVRGLPPPMHLSAHPCHGRDPTFTLLVSHLTPLQPTLHCSHCRWGLRRCPPAAPPPHSLATLGFLERREAGHPWVPAQHLCLGTSGNARGLTPHGAVLMQCRREASGLVTPFSSSGRQL